MDIDQDYTAKLKDLRQQARDAAQISGLTSTSRGRRAQSPAIPINEVDELSPAADDEIAEVDPMFESVTPLEGPTNTSSLQRALEAILGTIERVDDPSTRESLLKTIDVIVARICG